VRRVQRAHKKSHKHSHHLLPQLTAGGNRDAEIATPTRDDVFPPSVDNDTPTPEGSAIIRPVEMELHTDREFCAARQRATPKNVT
jgi:hypothetical protein